jgi:hypothetical protein
VPEGAPLPFRGAIRSSWLTPPRSCPASSLVRPTSRGRAAGDRTAAGDDEAHFFDATAATALFGIRSAPTCSCSLRLPARRPALSAGRSEGDRTQQPVGGDERCRVLLRTSRRPSASFVSGSSPNPARPPDYRCCPDPGRHHCPPRRLFDRLSERCLWQALRGKLAALRQANEPCSSRGDRSCREEPVQADGDQGQYGWRGSTPTAPSPPSWTSSSRAT